MLPLVARNLVESLTLLANVSRLLADRAIATFTAFLERDDGLGSLLRAIRAERLEPQAYAVAVMATDPRHPAGRLFANYVAARLDLPAEAIRSIDRRHRR